ncbi:UDP-glycosyltransferase 91C1-like [Pyrus ussuriensis x Pyrus communis]|uniref:UDP-glycosyltransferase 91C1-like n=1 Tax=Pyrus ussuriensis x Pyrus communis TaxID=2448454 RepID=A0A5N5H9T3_9ROSA|nr:UDP-glycosyltransferase 91C1-like [Pyrus ussuriensis x Pyrus communis]
MHELADGIEKSGLPFIWVVNNRPLVEGVLGADIIPPGFQTRVEDRGLVWRGWAPQLKILGHASVGGFLTHCGWSSVVEALRFGRVLILFSGAYSDQPLIARLMQDKRVGLEIPRDERDGSFTSDSVAELIRRVMVEKEGESIRSNAWTMKEIFGNVELNDRCLDEFTRTLETWPTST